MKIALALLDKRYNKIQACKELEELPKVGIKFATGRGYRDKGQLPHQLIHKAKG